MNFPQGWWKHGLIVILAPIVAAGLFYLILWGLLSLQEALH